MVRDEWESQEVLGPGWAVVRAVREGGLCGEKTGRGRLSGEEAAAMVWI